MQELINELVSGYTQSKFGKDYLQNKIREILEFVIPHLSVLLKGGKEEEIGALWETVKQQEEIREIFSQTLKIADRPIVIYVASKFINNQSIGPKIVKEALKWK